MESHYLVFIDLERFLIIIALHLVQKFPLEIRNVSIGLSGTHTQGIVSLTENYHAELRIGCISKNIELFPVYNN